MSGRDLTRSYRLINASVSFISRFSGRPLSLIAAFSLPSSIIFSTTLAADIANTIVIMLWKITRSMRIFSLPMNKSFTNPPTTNATPNTARVMTIAMPTIGMGLTPV